MYFLSFFERIIIFYIFDILGKAFLYCIFIKYEFSILPKMFWIHCECLSYELFFWFVTGVSILLRKKCISPLFNYWLKGFFLLFLLFMLFIDSCVLIWRFVGESQWIDLGCCEGKKPYHDLSCSAVRGKGVQRRNRVSCIDEVVFNTCNDLN